MHVSSTEPAMFHHMGEVSTLPEKYGVDFLWWENGWCGVQRKEVKDFIASVRDGRLGRELIQMRPLHSALLIIEGNHLHTDDGVMAGQSFMRWPHWWGVLWQTQSTGVQIAWTRDKLHTVNTIRLYEQWTQRLNHTSIHTTRDGAKQNTWGRVDDKEFQIHMLTGLPGVGRELAERIVDHYGQAPLAWTVTPEDLCQIKGIGKKKAQKMIEAFGQPSND